MGGACARLKEWAQGGALHMRIAAVQQGRLLVDQLDDAPGSVSTIWWVVIWCLERVCYLVNCFKKAGCAV